MNRKSGRELTGKTLQVDLLPRTDYRYGLEQIRLDLHRTGERLPVLKMLKGSLAPQAVDTPFGVKVAGSDAEARAVRKNVRTGINLLKEQEELERQKNTSLAYAARELEWRRERAEELASASPPQIPRLRGATASEQRQASPPMSAQRHERCFARSGSQPVGASRQLAVSNAAARTQLEPATPPSDSQHRTALQISPVSESAVGVEPSQQIHATL